MGMNRYMLTLLIFANLSIIFQSFCTFENNSVDLSIFNESDSTILIMFVRHMGASPRAKLLESGESIDFGRVYEASVQSYSTLWGYIAPAKRPIFSASMIRSGNQIEEMAIRIKGVSGRSLLQPFGQWNYEVIFGKKAVDLVPQAYQVPTSASVLDAFPTAKRKIMYTPRYILGLPQYAGLEDALEASWMLESKWQIHSVDGQSNLLKLAANITYIIDEARKAFQHGQADVPLHIPVEMRSSLPYTASEDEAASIAWS